MKIDSRHLCADCASCIESEIGLVQSIVHMSWAIVNESNEVILKNQHARRILSSVADLVRVYPWLQEDASIEALLAVARSAAGIRDQTDQSAVNAIAEKKANPPDIIKNLRHHQKTKSVKKQVDMYFDFLGKIGNFWKEKDVTNTLLYCGLTLSLIEPLVKNEVEQFGVFGLQSIPAIELGATLHAILGSRGQLANIKDVVDFFPELEPWRAVVEKAFLMGRLAEEIVTHIGSNPGALQKNLKKTLTGYDSRLISEVVFYLNICGKLRREKSGNSNALFLVEPHN
ncbi:MAG TPA: hypothetical protein VJ983_09550 [candidate division Zixibacteria bacterium]|nr:hypothetical protein [candidate division Zixibacteria bacterium]